MQKRMPVEDEEDEEDGKDGRNRKNRKYGKYRETLVSVRSAKADFNASMDQI
ncbi:MAG TPA: hypothetical protein VF773_17565 [Verrucomicrobiae bacterium]